MTFKKFVLFGVLLLHNLSGHSQKNSTGAVVAGGVFAAASLITFASIDQMQEGMEQQATEWFLANHPEERLFRLKIRNTNAVKMSDLSNVSCLLYTVYTYNPETRKLKDKWILLSFHSRGWVNDNGINFQNISYYLVSKQQWEEFIKLWIETISPVTIDWERGIPSYKKSNEKKFEPNNTDFLKVENNIDGTRTIDYYESDREYVKYPTATLRFNGKSILHSAFNSAMGIQEETFLIPLVKVDGDTYIRSNKKLTFLDSYLVGNEKTICLFKADEERLIQLDLDMVNYIQNLFD